MGWNFQKNIDKFKRYNDEISKIYCRYFQNIDHIFDLLTRNLTAQIRLCFDPNVQISSDFLNLMVDFKFEV